MFPTISVEEVGFLLWACPTAGSWVREGGGGLRFGLWEEERVWYISWELGEGGWWRTKVWTVGGGESLVYKYTK